MLAFRTVTYCTENEETPFGEQQRASDGSRRWQLGGYSVGSVEVVVLGRTLRRVSVYQD